MKNFTKIFMAVVALFAFACTTDTTFDQTVELGAGQTTITLSLDDESRTHITGKAGDEYPLYWSEGDKIAVNGKTSNALGESSHGQTTATFTVEGEQPRPWNIVYPAPAEGVTAEKADNYPVTFMASQPYTANTFAEGSTPMYAYVTESQNTGLKHLAGVLCFAPKAKEGENVTLKAVVVEVENGKIAGNFDVDCANGTLTAHADATNTVTVTFPENGLTLTTDATPIYVAVPAGEYGVVTLTLYTSDGRMMKGSFDTSAKEVSAGKIREFQEFEFNSNSEAEAGVFLIYDEATLREFAANIANFGSDTLYNCARLVSNIDLTGKEWSSIDSSTVFEFDGCNHEIKGLTAPLFNTASATIKNLHLTNVDIKVNAAYTGSLVSTYQGTSITDCSVSGEIVQDGFVHQYLGGIIGYSNTATTISGLRNSANITLKGSITTGANRIGGIAGSINKSGATFTNCHNSGNITIDKECIFENTGKDTNAFLLGGLIGYKICNMSNCTNRGNIEINGTVTGSRHCIGGVIADERGGSITNCTNNGNLIFGEEAVISPTKDDAYIGGFVGFNGVTATHDSNTNTGAIEIKEGAQFTSDTYYTYVGGYLGGNIGGDYKIKNITNSGTITIAGSFTNTLYLGGCAGFIEKLTISDGKKGFINESTGVITIKECASLTTLSAGGCGGNVVNIGNNHYENKANINVYADCANNLFVGGCIGYNKIAGGSDLSYTNSGVVTVGNSVNVTNNAFVGGNCASNLIEITAATTAVYSNSKELCVEGEFQARLYVGGNVGQNVIEGYAGSNLQYNNSGSVTIGKAANSTTSVKNNTSYIGGNSGYTYTHIDGCTTYNNNGVLTIAGGEYGVMYFGGCNAADVHKNGAGKSSGFTNAGAISIADGVSTTNMYTGGCVGYKVEGDLNDCTNSAAINLSGTHTGMFHVGGICGTFKEASVDNSTNLHNDEKGDITIKSGIDCQGVGDNTIRIGGVLGFGSDQSKTLYTISNAGDIVVESGAKLADGHAIGGLVGETNRALNSGAKSSGNITINNVGAEGNSNYVAGGVAISTSTRTRQQIYIFCDIKAIGYTNVGMYSGSEVISNSRKSGVHVGGSIWKSSEASEATTITLDNYLDYIYGKQPADDAQRTVFIKTYKHGWLEKSVDDAPQYPWESSAIFSTAAELIAWAANTNTATSTDNVELAANIDLTAADIDWTPFGTDAKGWKSIEGFAGGFDGKGFEIKGLNTPLFGTTKASMIKNLKLTDVAIEETTNLYVGALARRIDNTSADVRNCEVSGSVKAKYETAIANDHYIGAIVGHSTSANTFSDLTNYATVTVEGVAGATTVKSYVGGCAGYLSGSLLNSKNLGSVNANMPVSNTAYIAGVVAKVASLISCENGSISDNTKGAVTFGANSEGSGIVCLAGVADETSQAIITDCKNYGTVALTGKCREATLCGVVRNNTSGAFTRCTNNGKVSLSGKLSAESNTSILTMAGITFGATAAKFVDCHNTGAIESTATSSAEGSVRIGGIFAWNNNDTSTNIELDGCSNSGAIDVKGTFCSESGSKMLVGGAIASVNADSDVAILKKLTFKNGFTNSGAITIDANNNACEMNVGGVAGSLLCVDFVAGGTMKNEGNVTVNSDNTFGASNVGGLFGVIDHATATFDSHAYNNGEVKFDVKAVTGETQIGGFTARFSLSSYKILSRVSLNLTGFTNSKPVSLLLNETTAKDCRVAGMVARTASSVDITSNGNITNDGNITVNGTGTKGTQYGTIHLAGIICTWWGKQTLTLNDGADVTNNGNVTIGNKVSQAGVVQQGGFSGNHQSPIFGSNGSKLVNTGKISCLATSVTRICLGGVYGIYATSTTTTVPTENTGDVVYTSANGTSSTNGVGGIAGAWSLGTFENARCCCTVQAWGYPNVGMITGSARTDTLKAINCHIGGVIDTGANGEYTDDDGVEVTGWHSQPRTIAMGNYYNIIYSTPIDAATAVTDGCGYISAINAEPVYAEVE